MLATKGRVQAYLKKNRRYSAIRDIARITRLDAAIVRKSLRYLELKKLIKSKERKGGKRRDIQYRLVKT
jgi:DNA-binding transcriptional regulator YhcF (GntR family)